MARKKHPSQLVPAVLAALPLCALSLSCAVPAPRASARHVTSASALMQALATAHPGDMILLAPGDYGQLHLDKVKFAAPVTIASADSAKPAVLRGLSVEDSAGLRFERLLIETPTNASGVAASDSTDLAFEHLTVRGDDAPRSGLGFMVRNVTKVRIEGCDISKLWGGINHLDASDITIAGNKLHDLEEDAIRGGGSSDVVISDNYITDLFPGPGDHPDAVQFWGTNPHPTVQNIKVTGNVYVRGAGRAAQGIFLADGGYKHVTVSGNAIVGGLYNGIVVSGAEDARIEGNLVDGYTDQNSWIGVADSTDVQAIGNQSTGGFVRLKPNTALVERATRALKPSPPGDMAVLEAWRAQRRDAVSGAPGAAKPQVDH